MKKIWIGVSQTEKRVAIRIGDVERKFNVDDAINFGQSICLIAIALKKMLLGDFSASTLQMLGLPEILSNGAIINYKTLNLLLCQFSFQRCAEMLGVSELELTEVSQKLGCTRISNALETEKN